jgi:predicted O-methyltransferase YrrM
VLYALAHGNVLELGTSVGVRTAALLAGVEAHGGHVWSVDIDECGGLYAGHSHWTFLRGDSRNAEAVLSRIRVEDIDMILLDTLHTYEHVGTELTAWAKYIRPGGVICIHDTETFPGVRRAVSEFGDMRGWPVMFVLPYNGMAVIEVPQ